MSLSLPVTLGDRYHLIRRIGQGSFAQTFQAVDQHERRPVAIKVLREHFSDDSHATARFEREAAATRAVAHPNVIRVFDHGRDGAYLYLVMEWIDGQDLKSIIREQGARPVAEALMLMTDILAGLKAIHTAGIIHRDIKPQNILIGPSGVVQIADFGVARYALDTGMTETGTTIGTAAYMAPEQARGGEVGPQADLYAAGVVLFELLTGRVPFTGTNPMQVMYQHVHDPPVRPSSIVPSIPPAVDSIVLRALAKAPVERFTTASDMLNTLKSIETESSFPAPDIDATQSTRSMTIVPPGIATGAAITNTRRPPDAAATLNAPEPLEAQPAAPAGHVPLRSFLRRVSYIPAAIAIIVLLSTGFLAASAFRDGDADRQESPVSRSDSVLIPAATPTTTSSYEPAPTPRPQATATIEPQPTPTETEAAVPTATSTPEPSPTMAPEPAPTPVTPAPAPTPADEPAPEPASQTAENPGGESGGEDGNDGNDEANQDSGENQGENGNKGNNEHKPDKAEKEQRRTEKEQEKSNDKENKGQGSD